jgi:hypothetical protein
VNLLTRTRRRRISKNAMMRPLLALAAVAAVCLALPGSPLLTGGTHGDVNCSGSIYAHDALFILRVRARLSVSLPKGCPLVGP